MGYESVGVNGEGPFKSDVGSGRPRPPPGYRGSLGGDGSVWPGRVHCPAERLAGSGWAGLSPRGAGSFSMLVIAISLNPLTKFCDFCNNLEFLLVQNAGAFQKEAQAIRTVMALYQLRLLLSVMHLVLLKADYRPCYIEMHLFTATFWDTMSTFSPCAVSGKSLCLLGHRLFFGGIFCIHRSQ